MGRLVEDVTRLVGEIQALRGSRRAFRKELVDGERDRQRDVRAFLMLLSDGNRDRQRDVIDMCAHFAGRRMQMATNMKDERLDFLHNLRRTVRRQLRGLRADLAGARRAWSGEAA